MTNRSVLVHGVLAAIGLVLAYLVWTDETAELSEEAVTLFACDADDLTRVEWRSADRDVDLELTREDGDALTAWITVVRRASEGAEESTRFVGSAEVSTYLEALAPLRAIRSLGVLSDEQLGELELAEPTARITLRCGQRAATFRVGGRSFGSGARYVQPDEGGPVAIVERDVLAPLESAEHRLMQRSLHTFEPSELVSISVRAWGREKRLLQRNRLDPSHAEWVDRESPDRRNELYSNWLASYARLRVQRFLDADARPGADLEGASRPSETVFSLTLQGEDGEVGRVEMQRVDADAPTGPAYYVRTETTRSWVRVPTSVAASVEEDLRAVLELPPLERPIPPAPEPPTPEATSDAGPSAADAGTAP